MVSVPVFTEISTLSHPTSMEQGCISDRFSTLTLNMIAPSSRGRGERCLKSGFQSLGATGDWRPTLCRMLLLRSNLATTVPKQINSKHPDEHDRHENKREDKDLAPALRRLLRSDTFLAFLRTHSGTLTLVIAGGSC